MPAIRRRYHFRNIVLTPTPITSQNAIGGQTVDVLTRSGNFERLKLIDFLDVSRINDITDGRRAKIINVSAFTQHVQLFNDWIELGLNAIILGHYCPQQRGVYIVLEHGFPIAWCAVN